MTQSADPLARKAALRRDLLSRRTARALPARAAAAEAVAVTLLRELAGVAALAAFVPEATEPGFGPLPAAYSRLGAPVLLPVVPDHGRELDWGLFTGGLRPGRYGLLEPVGPRSGRAGLQVADAIVVPALAVDRRGVRLGRGGGYYDRALVHARPDAVLVTVLFDDEVLDSVPREPHDRLVTAVVTPGGGWEDLRAGAGP